MAEARQVFKNLDKALLEDIPCLFRIACVLKTNGIEFRGVPAVDQLLVAPAA